MSSRLASRESSQRRSLLVMEEFESRLLPDASSLTFTITNETGLGPKVGVFLAIYGKENINGDGNEIWGEYDLNGTFSPFTNDDTEVTAYQLTSRSQSITFANDDPLTRIDSGRIVISIGSKPTLTVNQNNGGVNAPNLGNPTDPNATAFYDFVEFTERATDGALFINTSTIDQFGFPVKVTIDPVDTSAPDGVGVELPRSEVFTAFTSYINEVATKNASAKAYLDLVDPTLIGNGTLNKNSYPYRILAPKDLVQFAQDIDNNPYSSPLKTYFNDALTALFSRQDGLTLSVPNPNFGAQNNNLNPNDPQTYTFTGATTTVTATGSDMMPHTYTVLRFTGTVAGQTTNFDVYRPLFSTNGSSSTFPPAPLWIPNSAESPGQMVLANDGVFADNLGQFPMSNPSDSISNLNNLKSNILANIENQVVSSLNRGVSDLTSDQWQDETGLSYYPQTGTANFYAGFLHSQGVSIDRKAYGFPYDDQAGQSSTMSVSDPESVNVTLGAWKSVTPPPMPLFVTGAPTGDGTLYQLAPQGGGYSVTGTAIPVADGLSQNLRGVLADVNGDGVHDQIIGNGPGAASIVVVIDGATGAEIARFTAFEASFTGGVHLAAGDLDRDGFAEVIVTPDEGGGPVVVIYEGAQLAAGANGGAEVLRFFGINDRAFRGGARPAIGDLSGDGVPELIVAAGFLGGPRITIWDGFEIGGGTVPTSTLADFFAFESSLRNGAFVAAGDVNGDGKADLIVGAGPGGGPHVRIVDGLQLLAAGGFGTLSAIPEAELASFFSGEPTSRGGVRVATRTTDGDPFADVVTGSGEDQPSEVQVYAGSTFQTASDDPEIAQTFDPFGSVLANGVFVG